ncbi:MAG: cob(I)yrinic acid a,c-diamide adenosyltransferase [Candidatus Aenigmatarchaeota archaeon]|nr:MAG: cob(I)yrinic acid a,c-diamide adenosyltransferase [Candidatus Aenigmarchaeota archaeon]
MIILYYGDGKGKTTASLGIALRAVGHGMKVSVIQFMKARPTGEYFAQEFIDGLSIRQFGRDVFVDEPIKDDFELAQKALEFARDEIQKRDVVILDEVNIALSKGLLKKDEVLGLLDSVPDGKHVVLTGRNPPDYLIKKADLVTEMREVKHPYRKGVSAVKGIDW